MTTNTNSTLRDEVLASISAIDEVVAESDMSVTMALMGASEKAMMIMENYTGEDVDAFTFFQEADKWDPKHPFKEKNIVMTIIKFIPNLIRLIINKLDKLFNGDKRTGLEKFTDAIKAGGSQVADFVGQLGEIAAGHKKEIVIGGTAVSLVGIEVATGFIRNSLAKARQAIIGRDDNMTAPNVDNKDKNGNDTTEGVSICKDGSGFETIVMFEQMIAWLTGVSEAFADYCTTVSNMKFATAGAKTQGDVVDNVSGAIEKLKGYNKTLEMRIAEWDRSNGFRSKTATKMSFGDFKEAWKTAAELVKNTNENISKTAANTQPTGTDSDVDQGLKDAGKIIESNLVKIQDLMNTLTTYFGAHTDVTEAIQKSCLEIAKKNNISVTNLIDALKGIIGTATGKVKDAAGKVADKFKKDEAGNGGASGDGDNTPPADNTNESYVDDSDDDDTVVLESVEYTKDLQTIEKTAKTVDEVNKLKAETFSSVKNVKYKAGKKALVIEGYSKIKHDNDKIKKPKDNETWDDVDMSAHDRRDPVRLIITGPGAEAYAESKKGGKKVVEECGDAGYSPKTVTESPDTSWYYTR